MKQKIVFLVFGFLLTLGISSCVKDSAPELGERGKTIIKFNDGPSKNLFYSPFTDVKTVTVFTFRRDANSAADLQKPIEFVLQEDATLIPAGYVDLPAAMYTVVADPSITVASGKINLRFAAGEYSKSFKIALNGAAWTNLSDKFCKAYKVFDANGKQVSAGQGTIKTTFAIKNQWDGVYTVEGTMTDVANPALTHVNVGLAAGGYDPLEIELRTLTPTKCAVFDNSVVGNFASPIWTGTGFSQYGSFSVIVEFDPATNTVIDVTNYAGQPASNTRYGQLDVTGFNDYNPTTKVVRIKYNMCQPSIVTTAPYVRSTWDETWTYTGPRQ